MTEEKRTTILLVLLAGNESTVRQLDPLVYQIQNGIDQYQADDIPAVYCLYHRWVGSWLTGSLKTHSFEIKKSPPVTFSCPFIDPYPPHWSEELDQADIEQSVNDFLKNLPPEVSSANGPIHIVVGAHGVPLRGFHPSKLFHLLLKSLMTLLHTKWSPLSWRKNWQSLKNYLRREINRLRLMGQPPGGIYSGSTFPDLTLDEVATAAAHLPDSRQGSLILHACDLSSLEVMCALRDMPHHIGAEEEMSGEMQIGEWFETLANPKAGPEEITAACFRSIDDNGKPEGSFSSHRTTIDQLLNGLNKLGKELLRQLKDENIKDKTVAAIHSATRKGSSRVRSHTHDLLGFARSLASSDDLSNETKTFGRVVMEELCKLQVSRPYNNAVNEMFKTYGGISIYLPSRTGPVYAIESLPCGFQNAAADWLEFVEHWTDVRS